ncbi:hypothetical protein GF358_04615 [Candidatus Woesearchaeota archaeon]|nr:hypothetical protein [Candidatus Woesearchaeota archaeon]
MTELYVIANEEFPSRFLKKRDIPHQWIPGFDVSAVEGNAVKTALTQAKANAEIACLSAPDRLRDALIVGCGCVLAEKKAVGPEIIIMPPGDNKEMKSVLMRCAMNPFGVYAAVYVVDSETGKETAGYTRAESQFKCSIKEIKDFLTDKTEFVGLEPIVKFTCRYYFDKRIRNPVLTHHLCWDKLEKILRGYEFSDFSSH